MDNLRFMRLWDLYRNLLTPTQREVTDLYFNLDLTVSEIAEQKGISRQAVSDCLAGCKKQLDGYEQKLGFERTLTEESLKLSFMMTDITKWSEQFFAAHPEFDGEQAQLNAILSNEYEAEVARVITDK